MRRGKTITSKQPAIVTKTKTSDPADGVRLQKYLAECGVASRRAAEILIRDGEVTINGKVAELGAKVKPGKDAVKVKGKLLRQETSDFVYIKMFKPTGVVTTLHDPEGRPTVKDLLTGVKQRVFPVGRLDYDSEGLIILTNDGEYAQSITHPTKEVTKTYIVKISGKLTTNHIIKLRTGVTLADGKAKAKHVEKIRSGDKYDWYKVVLTEGRNRQLRRMFERIGFDVMKLQRVAIGRMTIGRLQRGEFKFLTPEEAETALL